MSFFGGGEEPKKNEEENQEQKKGDLQKQKSMVNRQLKLTPKQMNLQNQIVSDDMVNLYQQDNEYVIDYENMMSTVQREKAMNQEGALYGCCEAFCVNSGYHCCCTSNDTSEFDKFGVGISLYFKWLKYLQYFFFLFGLINVPFMYIAYNVALQQKMEIKDFKSYLFATSLGSIAFGTDKCVSGVHKDDTQQAQLILTCLSGVMSGKYDDWFVGSYNDDEDPNTDCHQQSIVFNVFKYQEILDTRFNKAEADIKTFLQANCYNQKKCTVKIGFDAGQTYNSDLFLNTEWNSINLQDKKRAKIIKYLCVDQKYQINGFTFNSGDIAVLLGLGDFLVIILYLFMIVSLQKSQKVAIQNVKNHSVSADQFTLQLEGLPTGISKYDMIEGIWAQMEENLNELYYKTQLKQNQIKENYKFKILDVKLAEPNEAVNAQRKIGNLSKEKTSKMIKFSKQFDSQKKLPQFCKISDLLNFIENDLDLKKRKNAISQWQNLVNIQLKQQKIQQNLIKIQQSTKLEYSVAWITFATMEMRDQAYEFYYKTPLEFCFTKCCICCYDKKKHYFLKFQNINLISKIMILEYADYLKILLAQNTKAIKYNDYLCSINDKIVDVKPAPNPSNIQWENLSYSKASLQIRNRISFLICFLLLCGALVTQVGLKWWRDQMEKEVVDNGDCNQSYCTYANDQSYCSSSYFKQQIEYECQYKYDMGSKGCYCSQFDFFDADFQYSFPQCNNKKMCVEWYFNDQVIKNIPFLVTIFIIIYNIIMMISFKLLSFFEKHRSKSEQLGSKVMKTVWGQFLNTAVIVIIVNFKLKSKDGDYLSQASGGKYTNTNAGWYENVASGITLTMVTNVITKLGIFIFTIIIKIIARALDQSCSCDSRKTKKKKQQDYINLYKGPEFLIDLTYAQIVNTIFVTMLYSGQAPLLYFSCFFQILFAYFMDKISLLYVCQKPPVYDEKIEIDVTNILKYIVYIHLIFDIWQFGEHTIFYEIMQQSLYGQSTIDKYSTMVAYIQQDPNASLFDKYIYTLVGKILKTQCIPIFIILLIIVIISFLMNVLYGPIQNLLKMCCTQKSQANLNVLSRVEYLYLLNEGEIKDELRLIKITIKQDQSHMHPNIKSRYEQKLEILRQELRRRQQILSANPNAGVSEGIMHIQISGDFSYDIRHNKQYKQFFHLDQIVVSQDNIELPKSDRKHLVKHDPKQNQPQAGKSMPKKQ